LRERLPGYRGIALKVLLDAGVQVEDFVRLRRGSEIYEGILFQRSQYDDDRHIVIKLKNGYNVGIRVTPDLIVERLGEGAKATFTPPPFPQTNPALPKVSILSTGGTIASRVDYRTGAVTPAFSARDLYSIIPELSDIALIETEEIFSIFSEDMGPEHWRVLAKVIARHIEGGAKGIVVAHGTDTMGYTAAALSFALQNLPVPIILVGAQRSSDRPSSDAALNLLAAVRAAAEAPFAEVVVAMHADPSDETVLFHRGVKVRKCHTSRRDAFKSINAHPIAAVKNGEVRILTEEYRRRGSGGILELQPEFDERAALLKFHPGFNPHIIEFLVEKGYRGIIFEGTGLGHVSKRCHEALRLASSEGVFLGMTSQCLWGRVNMNVYYTGRDLQAIGIVPLEDMLPETALVKLMWALARAKEPESVKRIMLTNIAGEISPRTSFRWGAC
jgi:glutamyl-tRNA(Gln) amidotransferase subunit D